MLAVHYKDVSERHRLSRDQGSMDLKGVFNDIMVRLGGSYEVTKDQQVCMIDLGRSGLMVSCTRQTFAELPTMQSISLIAPVMGQCISM